MQFKPKFYLNLRFETQQSAMTSLNKADDRQLRDNARESEKIIK